MLRVVEVISDMNVGGAGRLLLNRIKNTDKSRFEITVVVPQKSMLAKLFRAEGVEVYEICGGKNKSFELKSFFNFYKTVKKLKPDIINTHGSMNARLSAKLLGVKVKLFTRHCDFPTPKIFRTPIIGRALRFINNILCDGAVAVSFSARENLLSLGISEKKIKVVINGVTELGALSQEMKKDIKAKAKIPRDAFVVGIFARLELCKDHATFLRAASLLKDRNCFFLVVGCGSEEGRLKELSRSLGLDGKLLFTGFVDDVSLWMNVTDLNVNCSVGTETSSLALSEGMSLGIPAVASDYAGNAYMVRDNVNGMIFPQRNFKALAEKIAYLMDNPDFYRRLSINARIRFEEELNALQMTKKTEEIYLTAYEKKTRKVKGL